MNAPNRPYIPPTKKTVIVLPSELGMVNFHAACIGKIYLWLLDNGYDPHQASLFSRSIHVVMPNPEYEERRYYWEDVLQKFETELAEYREYLSNLEKEQAKEHRRKMKIKQLTEKKNRIIGVIAKLEGTNE